MRAMLQLRTWCVLVVMVVVMVVVIHTVFRVTMLI